MSDWANHRGLRFLAVVLVVLCSPSASAQSSAPRVAFEAIRSSVSSAANRSVSTAFEVTLPSGYHVNSNAPLDVFLKPTRLLLETPDGVAVAETRYPEALLFKTQFSDQPLAVYEHRFRIDVTLAVADLLSGDYPLRATLEYQACSEQICYLPATRQTELTLTITGR